MRVAGCSPTHRSVSIAVNWHTGWTIMRWRRRRPKTESMFLEARQQLEPYSEVIVPFEHGEVFPGVAVVPLPGHKGDLRTELRSSTSTMTLNFTSMR